MPVQPPRAALTASATDTARLSGVGFGYADGPGVLRDVNLILPAGSFHFLTGPAGSGKSTLLKLLTLEARPTAGRVELFGEDAGSPSRAARAGFRRRMGLILQDLRLLDHLSAFDNAALPLRLAGGKREGYAGDVMEILDWVGLGGRGEDRPPALSGHEKRRLVFARAVVTSPELIIADEPTGGLDSATGGRLLKLFQAMNRVGTTVLIASHDEALAKASGASVLRLREGRVVGGGA
ncbi:MAG TPA: ATP-binding cassette domain-containing protein [Brevundimonas sp.]|nr:ATP-binding cassette domain-containing protein [Brevundimonas sp.]